MSALVDEILNNARAVWGKVEGEEGKELTLLIKDLEEARLTVFVKTADARPLLERCRDTSQALRQALEGGPWNEEARPAFSSFERAVTKLRNAILVRTQRAT